MGHRRGIVLALAAVAALHAGCAVGASQSSPKSYDFRRLDALLAAAVDSVTPGGAGFGVLLMQDGRVIYDRHFGPYDVGRVVPIASASKWMSGAVIMSLVAEGRLSLDDRVGRFFPELRGEKADITVRQLFSHTSGITGADPCIAARTETLATCANAILNLPLDAHPGSQFAYGGASMQVAGRIAEIVSGESFTTLFRNRITKPLGLSHTVFSPFESPANPLLAGGMVSSAPEYARFLQMILDGGSYQGARILPAVAVEEMLSDQTRGARLIFSPMAANPSLRSARYGIGVWREVSDSVTGRGIELSSPGAFGFIPWIDRDRGLVGVLTMRGLLRNAMPTYISMKRIIRETIPARPVARPEPLPPARGGG